jgi:hypothetical protein
MNVTKRKKQGCNLLHVFDEEGDVQSGEDALAIWKNHFVKVLAGSTGDQVPNNIKVHTEESQNGFSDHLCEPISTEEVLWAIKEMKKKRCSSWYG